MGRCPLLKAFVLVQDVSVLSLPCVISLKELPAEYFVQMHSSLSQAKFTR